MKKILVTTLLLICASMAQAQLYVNQDGITNTKRVNVTTSGGSDDIGIYVNLTSQSLAYTGILSDITAYYGGSNANYRYGIGVKGVAKRALDGNYGIYGYVPSYTYPINNYGAAIYGTNNASRIVLNGLYAGYFDGMVEVKGNLNVTNTITGRYLVATGNTSLMRESISLGNSSSDIISRLSNLQMGTFFQPAPKQVVRVKNETTANDERELETIDEIDKTELTRLHYGLIGDDLKEVFPDLVYDNEDGTQSINYVEMVPILVQAINELSAKVAELEGKDGAVKKVSAKATGINDVDGRVEVLALGQNKPNPFGTSTEIEVSVPESVQSAFVYVYDLQGKKVQQVNLTARGKQTVQLNAADLTDGMYLYSLIADGKVVETRRMIVEK